MPGDQVQEIKERLNIQDIIGGYVKLEKAGINLKARCPFHNEHTPSFFVSPTRQTFKCFGCGVGGDIFSFVQEMEGVEFYDALKELAQKAGVQLKKEDPTVRTERNRTQEVLELTAKYFQVQMGSKNGQLVREYLNSRGIKDETIKAFQIGYAPLRSEQLVQLLKGRSYSPEDAVRAGILFRSDRDGSYFNRFRGRVMFPIHNAQGVVVGFGGRKPTDELAKKMGRELPTDLAKYINTPQTAFYDKSRTLYGFDKAKTAIRGKDGCIVVEGYTDVILAHQAGYENVVAASGTALTDEQLHLIGRFTKNVTTAFDMDVAGDSATRRGIERAQALGFAVKVATPEGGKDPADVILDNPQNWEDSLAHAKSVPQFYLDSALAKYDPSNADGKREIGAFLAPVLASIASRIEQSHWVQELAHRLRVQEEDVWEEVRKAAAQTAQNAPREVKQPLLERPGVGRVQMLQEAIIAHIAKQPTLLQTTKESLSSLPEDDAMVQFLQKFDILDSTTTYSEASVLERLDEDHKMRLGEVLLEAEVMGQTEFSARTLMPILVLYEKIVLERQLQGLERQLSESTTDDNSEELLQKVQTISQRLKELSD